MSMSTDDEDDLAVERLLQPWSPDFTISALPNETLHLIFSLSCPSTLFNLSLVSHRFRAIAERILYETISIVDHFWRHNSGDELSIPWRTIQCCRSLMARPHLSDNVRRLSIRWVHCNPQAHSRSPSSSSFGDAY